MGEQITSENLLNMTDTKKTRSARRLCQKQTVRPSNQEAEAGLTHLKCLETLRTEKSRVLPRECYLASFCQQLKSV